MRFNTDQKYYFLSLDYTSTTRKFAPTYYPWEDKLNSLSVEELTCMQHHKVTNGFTDEKSCDGFIFHDGQQASWYNQFPEAHYGQLDTSGDWIVRKAPPNKDVIYTRRPYMTEVCSFLENAMRGIRELKERRKQIDKKEPVKNGDTPEWLDKAIQALEDLYKQIDQELQTKFALKAVNIGYTARFIDARPPEHMPDIPEVVLVAVNQDIEHIAY